MEPGVQIDPTPERTESMIRQDEEGGILSRIFGCLPDQLVHPPVQVFDHSGVRPAAVLKLPVEHVLDAIARIEHARHHASTRVFKRTQEHRLPLLEDAPGLFQERVAINHALV